MHAIPSQHQGRRHPQSLLSSLASHEDCKVCCKRDNITALGDRCLEVHRVADHSGLSSLGLASSMGSAALTRMSLASVVLLSAT